MKNDLISRSKLIEAIKDTDVTYNPHLATLLNSLVNLVNKQPTAVGQCDDCKHAGYYPDCELIYCSEISCVMPFDGFCHRFEKVEVDK